MREEGRWGKLGALALLGALVLATFRGFRRRGLKRAFGAATCAGLAVAAFSTGLIAPFLSSSPFSLLLLIFWFLLTHTGMAFAEGVAASWVLARLRLRPGQAFWGALLSALVVHLGGVLVCLMVLWRHLLSFLEGDIPLEGFLVLFAPFAPAGALLASLGTFYGDVVRAERASPPTDLPG